MLGVTEFRLPEQLDDYRRALGRFMAEEGEALAEETEATGVLPARLWPLFREAGLFRLTLPRQYGGLGLTPSQYAPLLEEVAHSHGAIRLLVHMWNWISSHGILRYGTEEQRRRYLLPLAQGESHIAFSLTEPGTGTGTDIQTTARREGDIYYLAGEKHLVSYADIARAIQVVAYTDRARRADGITMFLVEKDTPGLTIAPQPEGMGMRGSFHGLLRFKDAPVPARQVLGQEGQGLHIALDILDLSRAFIAISCVGLAQEMFDRSIKYAWRRVTFGKPIAQRQAIQGIIANMDTEIAAGRALTMEVIRHSEAGEDIRADAAKAKLFALRMVGRVSDWALEVHGGLGYLKAMSIERLYRDARALWFEEGSPTIQQMVIAQSALGAGHG
ncbi:MAG: acyl-CoA dehydrogenase family protein [Dehalococcoidia bacterium]